MTDILTSVGIDIGTSPPMDSCGVHGDPDPFHILGGSESRLRNLSALLPCYGLTPAPRCGAPVVEVPK